MASRSSATAASSWARSSASCSLVRSSFFWAALAHSHASALAALSRGKVCRQFVGSGCTSGSAVPTYGRRCPASDLEWIRCLPAPPDLRRQASLNEPHEPWSREPRDSEGRRECAECSKMIPYGVRDGIRTVGLDTPRHCVARWTLSCRVVGVGQGGRLSGSTSKVDERRPSGPREELTPRLL